MQTVALEPVDAVTVTILVDNVSDMLLEDQGRWQRDPLFLDDQALVLSVGDKWLVVLTLAALPRMPQDQRRHQLRAVAPISG
jgi:hypothetical protein